MSNLLQRARAHCTDESLVPLEEWTTGLGQMGIYHSTTHEYIGFALLAGQTFWYQQETSPQDREDFLTQARAIAAFAGALLSHTGSHASTSKEWVYKQGTWTQEDMPLVPDEVENSAAFRGYSPSPRSLGVEGEASAVIWGGIFIDTEKNEIREPLYPYHVELNLPGKLFSFYIADEPSYLQLFPQIMHSIQSVLQVESLARHYQEQSGEKGKKTPS